MVLSIGEIQNVITKVASNNNLYDRGIALGLDPFIVKNPGQWGITAGKKTMPTTIEAIIGAVFYDSAKNGDDLERVLTALGLAWPE
jgi:ribonuclease-3